jgi:hypothetical protein
LISSPFGRGGSKYVDGVRISIRRRAWQEASNNHNNNYNNYYNLQRKCGIQWRISGETRWRRS